MAQEGVYWLSVMIRFGPCWHKSKTKWANIVSAVLYFGNKDIIMLPKLNMLEQLKIHWLSFGLT